MRRIAGNRRRGDTRNKGIGGKTERELRQLQIPRGSERSDEHCQDRKQISRRHRAVEAMEDRAGAREDHPEYRSSDMRQSRNHVRAFHSIHERGSMQNART